MTRAPLADFDPDLLADLAADSGGLAAESFAALASLLVEAPTRPIRRVAAVITLLIASVLVLALVMMTSLARQGGSDSPSGCATDLPAAPAGGANHRPATAEQRANAAVVVATGRQMSVPDRGVWIALATALQESGLRNLPGGDRDSLGLFQQRPTQGWGSVAQISDPAYAATQFYRHLLLVPGWESMPLAAAAQAVQRSAFPGAYTRWASMAADLLAGDGGAAPAPCQPADAVTSGQASAALAFARAQLGKPYVWGATGPGSYDCSGLTGAAWKAAGVSLPRTSAAQASAGTRVPLSQLQPGDLLFWSSNGQISGVHHVALFLGSDGGGPSILEAPQTGIPVRTRPVRLPGPTGGGERELVGFGIRPASPTAAT